MANTNEQPREKDNQALFIPDTSLGDNNACVALQDSASEISTPPVLTDGNLGQLSAMMQDIYRHQLTQVPQPGVKIANTARLRQGIGFMTKILADDTVRGGLIASYSNLRNWILTMHVREVQSADVQASQVLPAIEAFVGPNSAEVRSKKQVNDWFVEELTILYRKWKKGDLLADTNRGLTSTSVTIANSSETRTTYTLDKNWEYYRDFADFGNNGLVNGQMWYSRAQLMRDGAHGSRIGGISGTEALGAYSVVMGLKSADQKYGDVDNKLIIEYEGTSLSTPDPHRTRTANDATTASKTLMKSLDTGRSVRVIRTFEAHCPRAEKLIKIYRYDGLYTVISKRCLNQDLQIWRFRMTRNQGQGELRQVLATGDHRAAAGTTAGRSSRRR